MREESESELSLWQRLLLHAFLYVLVPLYVGTILLVIALLYLVAWSWGIQP